MPSPASTITFTVTIDTTNQVFSTKSSLGEVTSNTSLGGTLADMVDRLTHLHSEFADVGDDDLTDQGKAIRDTPFVFVPPTPPAPPAP